MAQGGQQAVRVCGECNNGWLSRLEAVVQRVLKPFILGETREIAEGITAWVQKTALTAMLVSSEAQWKVGYGLLAAEYRGLWTLRDKAQPLPASRFWVGVQRRK